MDDEYYKRSVFRELNNRQHGFNNKRKLQKSAKNSLALTQRLKLDQELSVHKGCVNSIVWNDAGDKILSGSDDQKLVVTNPFSSKVLVRYTTVHRSNIFSAKFLPYGDNRVVSCSGNGSVLYTDFDSVPLTLDEGTLTGGSYRAPNDQANYFNCHTGTAYEVIPIPSEPNAFMSCGEDGTVRFFDLRVVSKCNRQYCRENILVYSPTSVTALSLAPISHNYLAVGCSDFIRIFDRRFMKLVEFPPVPESSNASPPSLHSFGSDYYTKAVKHFKIPNDDKRSYRVTSLVHSPDEQELLVSFSSEYLYLFDMSHSGVNADGTVATVTKGRRRRRESPKVLRKLRLRGDWSDTGPEARPLSEVSAQSRPQLNSGIMNRMTGLLSRMLNEPRQRNARSDENSFDRVSDGISILFGNESGTAPSSEDAAVPSTSAAASVSNTNNDTSPTKEATKDSSSSSSGSEDDALINRHKYDYMMQKFLGHRNARTMIKEANFWGDDFILSGSDCGHCFVWSRKTGELVNLLQADRHVVNCVQPHQTLPVLATSGIDYNVKIWTPSEEESVYDEQQASDIMQRNRLMLEETRDTVTVPATFMIRMLACLHSYNRTNNATGGAADEGNDSNNNEDGSSSSGGS